MTVTVPDSQTSENLHKRLGLFGVYAIATGTTLSAGFFLLPGIAFAEAGPAMIVAYMIAAVPLIPAMISKVELATAMPKAGGVYYFLDRAMGPLIGTIGGFGTWLALILKVSFALIGMGAYIQLFFPNVPLVPVAVGFALLLGGLNLVGTGASGGFQIALVIGLLAILLTFIGTGIPQVNVAHFENFWGAGMDNITATAGLVYVSYVGLTKVASLSEEIADPERNMPMGIFLAMATALLIYLAGTTLLVGLIPADQLAGNLTSVATAAEIIGGKGGLILISIAAMFAFISVANAGTLSASRYPFAMSRDLIVPAAFQKVNASGVPVRSTLLTVGIIVATLVFFDATKIAKLASAFQLMMFALVCLAVIVMRESRIDAYDPGYKSPFYPWTQIVGIISPIWLIVQMGWLPTLFSAALITFGTVWYFQFAIKRVSRSGAIYHVFERLGQLRYEGLETELRGIMKEKGLRQEDPFDELVARSHVIDCVVETTYEDVVERSAIWLSSRTHLEKADIKKKILEGATMGATPVTRGVALPHFRDDTLDSAEMVIVRGRQGISIQYLPMGAGEPVREMVRAIFVLASPRANPTQHLRILAEVARHVEDESFESDWKSAVDEQELKEVLLREERSLSLFVHEGAKTEAMIGKALFEINMPDDTLVALLRREDRMIIPQGKTILESGDRLTIIGEPDAIEKTYKMYFGQDGD